MVKISVMHLDRGSFGTLASSGPIKIALGLPVSSRERTEEYDIIVINIPI